MRKYLVSLLLAVIPAGLVAVATPAAAAPTPNAYFMDLCREKSRVYLVQRRATNQGGTVTVIGLSNVARNYGTRAQVTCRFTPGKNTTVRIVNPTFFEDMPVNTVPGKGTYVDFVSGVGAVYSKGWRTDGLRWYPYSAVVA